MKNQLGVYQPNGQQNNSFEGLIQGLVEKAILNVSEPLIEGVFEKVITRKLNNAPEDPLDIDQAALLSEKSQANHLWLLLQKNHSTSLFGFGQADFL